MTRKTHDLGFEGRHEFATKSMLKNAGNVESLSESLDGKTCVTCGTFKYGLFRSITGTEKYVRVWNVDTSKVRHVLKGHRREVNSVSLSSDGKTCVSDSLDKTVRVWDVDKGTQRHVLEGHTNWVRTVVLSPLGDVCTSVDDSGQSLTWDVRAGRLV